MGGMATPLEALGAARASASRRIGVGVRGASVLLPRVDALLVHREVLRLSDRRLPRPLDSGRRLRALRHRLPLACRAD